MPRFCIWAEDCFLQCQEVIFAPRVSLWGPRGGGRLLCAARLPLACPSPHTSLRGSGLPGRSPGGPAGGSPCPPLSLSPGPDPARAAGSGAGQGGRDAGTPGQQHAAPGSALLKARAVHCALLKMSNKEDRKERSEGSGAARVGREAAQHRWGLFGQLFVLAPGQWPARLGAAGRGASPGGGEGGCLGSGCARVLQGCS